MKIITRYILIVTILSFCASCHSNESIPDEDILVKVGKEVLTKNELSQNMPYGLNQSDSTKFARAFIRSWIDRKTLSEIATKNISDLSRINRMVEDYRNELIMWEYRQQMYESRANKELSPDSIAAYYEIHKNEFKTTAPYIKGIYIKVADYAANLDKLKKWYRSDKAEDIDNIEKYGLSEAIHYNYFRDKWIDWEQIESKIPYDFGTNHDLFLKQHKYLETSIGGFTYLLSISEYLPSGSIMPLELASELIRETIINRRRLDYDRQLRQNLYNKGIKDGDIVILCDLES